MRIAVFSDTHGKWEGLALTRSRLGEVDLLVHAGDHYRDAQAVAAGLGLPPGHIHAVVGNCDYGTPGPEELILELDGVRILLLHGHRHEVKRTLQPVFYRAQEAEVQAVIFGHSHVPVCMTDQGLLLFNPGSYSEPRVPGPGSCGLLNIEAGKVQAKHVLVGAAF